MQGDGYDDRIVIPALQQKLDLMRPAQDGRGAYLSAPEIDLADYDRYVLCLSGGKDSLACLLRLKDMGADFRKVELWHHDVDGREGSHLMDWLFMADYNRKLAAAFGLPMFFSWLAGGFEEEMTKEDSYSQAHKVETPEGLMTLERDHRRSKPGTRLRFPQISADLQTRWCSSALKIDVGRRALNNQARFDGARVLFITGERREESPGRAKYNQLERHACDRRDGRKARHVDAWRAVLHLKEEAVWDLLRRHGVIAPVPYRLGWSRSSCMTCIYNSDRIWATIKHYFRDRIDLIAAYEARFGTTIRRERIGVLDLASTARPFEIDDLEALEQAAAHEYTLPVLLNPGQTWQLPAGAFSKEGCGSV